MKLAFILLGIFLFMVSVRTQSRELTDTEKLSLLAWEGTRNVRNYMAENTNVSNLGFADRLGFSALTKSCLPLVKHIEKIEREDPAYADQSKQLLQLYALCSEGTLKLTSLYIKSQENDQILE